MTYDEMHSIVEARLDEGEAASTRADKVLPFVPIGDKIIDELHALFDIAADEFEAARDKPKSFAEIVAAATKLRDAALAWARYVEAVAAPAMTKEEMQEPLESLVRKALIVKTSRMRRGRPVYVATEYATEEELEAQRKSKQ
jgi:hypothetical protein